MYMKTHKKFDGIDWLMIVAALIMLITTTTLLLYSFLRLGVRGC